MRIFRRVTPCAVKNMCCASRFCMGGRGAAGSRSKNLLEGAVKQNAGPGEQFEAPRRRWKQGQEQRTGPENQDSRHMLRHPGGLSLNFWDVSDYFREVSHYFGEVGH